jgi:hypothetical protein
MRVKTFKDLAAAINAMDNGFTATTEKSWTSTDTHPKGVRWRIAGKGRKGTKIIVKDLAGKIVIQYDTSETTPVYMAVMEAKRLFGNKLDLDPGEIFEVGTPVRVVSNFNLAAHVVAIVMKGAKSKKIKHYDIQYRNGHPGKKQPWELQRS